jgi:uncharacterized protein (TIGR02284 family)
MEFEGKTLSGKINYLIAIAEDANRGYADVANDTEDATLKKIFTSLAAERAGYATQLQNQLRVLVGKTAADDEPLGVVKRTWAFLKSAVLDDDDDSIIMECIKGEEVTLKEYAYVLENIKSESALGKLLVKQRNGINSSLNGIKNYLNNR